MARSLKGLVVLLIGSPLVPGVTEAQSLSRILERGRGQAAAREVPVDAGLAKRAEQYFGFRRR
jgi:hypothetical protein